MAISSPGIGSNLDVNSIISQLMMAEARPLNALATKEAGVQARISAFGSLNSALSSFHGKLAALSTPAKFQAITAKSADEDILKGSANAKAVPGTYKVDVTALAQAQTISSAGRANTTAAIGDGGKTTLTFSFGTITGGKLENGKYVTDATATQPNPAFTPDVDQKIGTVVIDSSNNSLQGIRDAINKAKIGVTATIVSDGSANPNHLVLTSTATGEKSSMKVTVTRDAAAPFDPANAAHTALSDLLAYDPAAGGVQNLSETASAQDTALTVNGISVVGSTRSIKEAIQGVTLDIKDTGSTTLTVDRDTTAVEANINALVKAYNDLDKTIKSLTAYNPATRTGGPLLGDAAIRTVQEQVRRTLGAQVGGTGSSLTSLSQVGVAFQKDGSLAVDATKLKNAINNNFGDLATLFAATGTTSDSLVSFVSSTSKTAAGNSTIEIDTLATRGSLTGSAQPGLTIDAGVNDKLTMTVNDVTATVTLTAGTYTADALVAQLQSSINGTAAFSTANIGVSVNLEADGKLTVSSTRYGSTSNVKVAGDAALGLFGSATLTGTAGVDVAGKINGVAATGSGQKLTGAKESPSEGMVLEITGGLTGARGTVNFSHGYASLLSTLTDTFIKTEGLISRQTESLKKNVEGIEKSREALNRKLDAIEKRYRAQFTALDTMLGKMNTTSTFLGQQLDQISNLSSQG